MTVSSLAQHIPERLSLKTPQQASNLWLTGREKAKCVYLVEWVGCDLWCPCFNLWNVGRHAAVQRVCFPERHGKLQCRNGNSQRYINTSPKKSLCKHCHFALTHSGLINLFSFRSWWMPLCLDICFSHDFHIKTTSYVYKSSLVNRRWLGYPCGGRSLGCQWMWCFEVICIREKQNWESQSSAVATALA